MVIYVPLALILRTWCVLVCACLCSFT
uniref:Uncharacterized protein n=1 Tax=Rhizophora mucronata TaxID=61149 RepID=A0A2P2NAH5_RHIMU